MSGHREHPRALHPSLPPPRVPLCSGHKPVASPQVLDLAAGEGMLGAPHPQQPLASPELRGAGSQRAPPGPLGAPGHSRLAQGHGEQRVGTQLGQESHGLQQLLRVPQPRAGLGAQLQLGEAIKLRVLVLEMPLLLDCGVETHISLGVRGTAGTQGRPQEPGDPVHPAPKGPEGPRWCSPCVRTPPSTSTWPTPTAWLRVWMPSPAFSSQSTSSFPEQHCLQGGKALRNAPRRGLQHPGARPSSPRRVLGSPRCPHARRGCSLSHLWCRR